MTRPLRSDKNSHQRCQDRPSPLLACCFSPPETPVQFLRIASIIPPEDQCYPLYIPTCCPADTPGVSEEVHSLIITPAFGWCVDLWGFGCSSSTQSISWSAGRTGYFELCKYSKKHRLHSKHCKKKKNSSSGTIVEAPFSRSIYQVSPGDLRFV